MKSEHSSIRDTDKSEIRTYAVGTEINFNTYAETDEYYSVDSKLGSPEKTSNDFRTADNQSYNLQQSPELTNTASNVNTLDVNTNKQYIIELLNMEPNKERKSISVQNRTSDNLFNAI